MKRTNGGLELYIKNPTRYEASITLFAETAADAKAPLEKNAFLKWPKVGVKAGGMHVLIIGKVRKI